MRFDTRLVAGFFPHGFSELNTVRTGTILVTRIPRYARVEEGAKASEFTTKQNE
jgi:hypothetical protein